MRTIEHTPCLPTCILTAVVAVSLILAPLSTAARDPYIAAPLTESGIFTPGIEGPACDRDGNLYVVNYHEEGTIGRITASGKAELWLKLPEGSTGNGIVFDRAGLMYVTDYTGHNVLKIDPVTKHVTVFAHSDTMNQPNDLCINIEGSLYLSDPAWKQKSGQLFFVSPHGDLRRVAVDLGTTNGIELSPDENTLYVNESIQRGLWAYPVMPDKSLGERRLVRQFEDFGFDGMRCDADGLLYVTRHGKGTVVVLTPTGETVREIDVLGAKPTNLCFGGPDGTTVYVTEVEHRRIVVFHAERPGLAWQRLHPVAAVINGAERNNSVGDNPVSDK